MKWQLVLPFFVTTTVSLKHVGPCFCHQSGKWNEIQVPTPQYRPAIYNVLNAWKQKNKCPWQPRKWCANSWTLNNIFMLYIPPPSCTLAERNLYSVNPEMNKAYPKARGPFGVQRRLKGIRIIQGFKNSELREKTHLTKCWRPAARPSPPAGFLSMALW